MNYSAWILSLASGWNNEKISKSYEYSLQVIKELIDRWSCFTSEAEEVRSQMEDEVSV